MKSKVHVKSGSIPDGQYPGFWGGYSVRFVADRLDVSASTEIGVRGLNIPCIVTVFAGVATVEVADE